MRGLALRPETILACATAKSNKNVARKLRVTAPAVGKWRKRFVAKRPDGLMDEPRPGAPRTITYDAVEAVVTRALESTPQGATHWSTRQMAKAVGLSLATVGRIWRAFGLTGPSTLSSRRTLCWSRRFGTSSAST